MWNGLKDELHQQLEAQYCQMVVQTRLKSKVERLQLWSMQSGGGDQQQGKMFGKSLNLIIFRVGGVGKLWKRSWEA